MVVTNTELTDEELFRRISEGDEPAFETVFHRYVPKIEPVVRRLTDSDVVTKDIIQDVFLGLWVGREGLDAIVSPSSWIFKMVYNRTYSYLEQRATRQKARQVISLRQEQKGANNDTEAAVFFSETARLVRHAIHALPPQTQRIYRLSREAGLSNQEIAEELGISIQTVKNTLSQSGRSIKTYLTERGIIIPLSLLVYWLF